MRRRTFDILLSAGGLLLAAMLLVFGLYFQGRYDFAHSTVEDQLSAQKIYFPPLEALSDEEKETDLAKYAGELVDSGKKAEVYANQFIGEHLKQTGENEALWGKTYAELGALARSDSPPAPVEEINEVRETVFKGEMLRGVLLTTYGFWQFGEEARFAMVASFIGAAVLLLLALLGFWHALRTPKEATI
jgi:hypothetical protein